MSKIAVMSAQRVRCSEGKPLFRERNYYGGCCARAHYDGRVRAATNLPVRLPGKVVSASRCDEQDSYLLKQRSASERAGHTTATGKQP